MTKKLLIIDNAPLHRKQFISHVKHRYNQGYQIVEADQNNYSTVLSGNKNFAAAFIDIRMPKASEGLGIAAKLIEKHPHIPIIIYTAYPIEDYLEDCIDIGVDGYISKMKIGSMSVLEFESKIAAAQERAKRRSSLVRHDPTKVFIIHGHDHKNRNVLKTLLAKEYKLKPVVLAEKAWKGRWILEKFFEEAGPCSMAIAILTPDDLIARRTKNGKRIKLEQVYDQARPNVIFEVGWFIGQLGKSRIILLKKKGTQLPSDILGLGWIEFNKDVSDVKTEIKNELVASKIIH